MRKIEANSDRIALVAGNGQFPLEFAKKARALGKTVVVIAFVSETDPKIADYTTEKVFWIKVGQLSKLLSIVKSAKVSQLVFAGGISRVKLFRNFFPDFKALTLFAKLGTIKDDSLLRALAQEIEQLGVEVINGATYLDNAVPEVGQLSSRALTSDEVADALVGWKAAKSIGLLDIGQSVLVYKSLVIAVEAVEGTDQAILRAGQLSGLDVGSKKQSGLVLVKLCKPHQDKRLDLPSIGPKTIVEMKAAGVTAAVIEAQACLIIEPLKVVELANLHNIALFAAGAESDLIAAPEKHRDFSF